MQNQIKVISTAYNLGQFDDDGTLRKRLEDINLGVAEILSLQLAPDSEATVKSSIISSPIKMRPPHYLYMVRTELVLQFAGSKMIESTSRREFLGITPLPEIVKVQAEKMLIEFWKSNFWKPMYEVRA